MIADRPLYLDKSGNKLVEEGDASAASQLAGQGAVVNADEARRLSLVEKDGKVVQDFVAGVGDLRKQLADAEAEQAAFAKEIESYRSENAVKDIPNTMEAKRVAIESKVEQARLALAQAIKAEKGHDPFKGESQATAVKPAKKAKRKK